MSDQGIKIVEKDGVVHLSGVLNEYADFSGLTAKAEPLRLNMKEVSRLNSIGIRNLLKFLSDWGSKAFSYDQCPSEFIDQINMIPALLGTKAHGKVLSLYVPYECSACDHDDEVLAQADDFRAGIKAGREPPKRPCPKCGQEMAVLTDSFFVFLSRQP